MTAFPEKVAIEIGATLVLGAAVGLIFWILAKLRPNDHRAHRGTFPDCSAAIENAGGKNRVDPAKEPRQEYENDGVP